MNYFRNPTHEEILNFLHNETLEQEISSSVAGIIEAVKINGDHAVREFTTKFDKVNLKGSALDVSQKEWKVALKSIDPKLVNALKSAKDNIIAYHEKQKRHDWTLELADNSYIKERSVPLKKAGIYVPGGTAPLVSSVLMSVLPAQVAGVKEIYVSTPPRKDGNIDPGILAACELCSVAGVFKMGGAQAIAALAFGTESIPQVDIIVGPGNPYVTEAKRQLFGTVAIDMVAGPSEVLVLADNTTNPRYAALDLLSQLEHGKDSKAICISISSEFTQSLKNALVEECEQLSRGDILSVSMKEGLIIIEVDSIYDMIELTNAIAPEHLEIMLKNPETIVDKITNAGVIFLGDFTPEAVGDYVAGPSHVLPTGGKARFFSGLSVYHFQRKMSVIHYSEEKLKSEITHISTIALCEGLDAHSASAVKRCKE
ncbi:MAG: histidinol dehydrogenase [Candidatus Auribacter fodinae]|jgi:histidinol dehydrogenase|uniref:Histidinol dehydrogenase n=1 Tax=Candidatus Auribacter fodinae TaxID=2093366 RepID=A0A3A4R1G6_9BACT|nr:MAG: histidinol dehydrogenase [Candidatus Auribacter fodinae]